MPRRAPFIAYFLFALIAAVAGQALAGAYASDLHWSDEASHYVNGLLIHDYIAHGLLNNPIHFAIGYYANYPKVAIGHWPPLFYPLEAALFFITGPSVAAAIFLEALLAAALAATVGAVVGRLHGWIAGLLAAAIVIAAPDVFTSIEGVMLDVPLALMALLATLSWARYLESGKWEWSLAFALLASGAILTKGNGFFLALLPPLSLVLARRRDLLRHWQFWLPVPIVAVLTVPWYAATYRIAADGFNFSWGPAFTATALPVYGMMFVGLTGIAGLLIAAAGAVRVLWRRETGWEQSVGVAALAATLAGFIYHCVVPVAIEQRYLVSLVPDLVILAFFAARWELPVPARYRTAAIPLAILLMIGFQAKYYAKPDYGLGDAGRIITAAGSGSPFLLVGSSPGGEGAVTAEVATVDRARRHYVLRGFEVLAKGNFMGSRYTPAFATPADLKNWIEANEIGWVVLDTSADSMKWTHNRQLAEITASDPEGWTHVARFTNPDGKVDVWRLPARRRVNVAAILPRLMPAKVIGRY